MAHVLVVGDDKDRTSGVRSLLSSDGHTVATAKDVSRWRDQEREAAPELVVAAIEAPERLLARPLGKVRGFAPPILFVQRESDDVRQPHVEERLVDWIASPFAAEDLLGRVDALVRVRRVVLHHKETPDESRPSGLLSWFGRRVRPQVKPLAPYLEVAGRVAAWSDQRDGFDPGHAERVTNFAAMIADELGVSDPEAASLLRASMLHDIGKVALPVEVLQQKQPLVESQMRLVRTHAERGAAILKALDRDDAVADTILHHHEHLDGSGYNGRRGDDIPRSSRILAVAEGFDAMTTSLVRARLTPGAAIELMQDYRGIRWDPDCVDALVDAMKPKSISISSY